MAIHVALHHRSHYTYDRAVGHAPHVVRLRPAPHCRTPVLSYSLKVRPEDHFLNWQQDPFSNYLARLVFPEKTRELLVEVDLVAEMSVYNPFDFFLEPTAEKFPFAYDPGLHKELEPFQRKCWLTPAFSKYLAAIRRDYLGEVKRQTKQQRLDRPEAEKPRTIDFIADLNRRLAKDIQYLIRLEPGVQTPEETLKLGSGSCRDTGWLLVQLFRHLGLAARFVSGYLIQLTPDVKSLDGPSGTTYDFTDLHAWCEVYLPGAGWVGLDPTSGLLAGEGHLPLACTPEPSSAAPITGAVDECESKFVHEMKVTRIHESPRVTKPYTEEQWQEIESLGHQIDVELQAGDARLTMGGEPTFISIDNMDGAEWNFTAVGPEKRRLSAELIRRLKRRFAPGGLLHFGQGKWYPGEPLPRWALAAYWRKDGVPIWKDDSLIADEVTSYGHGAREARELMLRLANILDLDPRHVLPAYEDAFYYTWRERRLPSNVTPEKSNLKDRQERDRIARIFQQGLGEVVGYSIPIQKAGSGSRSGWVSGAWFLRDEDILWLTPGDSAMGLRLPLDSVPWVAGKDHPWLWAQDPSQRLPPLPKEFPYRVRPELAGQQFLRGGDAVLPAGYGPGQRAQKLGAKEEKKKARPLPPPDRNPDRRPGQQESAPWIIRTALCVEPRDGRLHVFMPPVATTEDYLDLVAGVETAVTELGLPVLIEGETPPPDHRLNHIKVTPDPGVIEVNLHPAHNWNELVNNTTILYEEARLSRLGTEKFMIDGRHIGTGGGNHVVVGGPAPGDSPFLRRPDLLRSLLAYWQNHPSLSFLFSGLFIGPTSQHPRVDEARNDSLYEIETAFRELERRSPRGPGSPTVPPWLVDRLFRHLLIDVTGNTHRAEFCIDKLFSPEGSAGRLGLVELRAFEMPPHARMSLTQQLLLRSLIARFWKHPCERSLVRWSTELHDRFMLPHFVEQDFEDVIEDLRDSGYPLKTDWFGPHLEFRFPHFGGISQRGVQLEVRQALEPWHVLGEEGTAGGTVRYVDSSVERLQVKVRGLTDSRHVITCNGHALPLHPTGTEAEYVAGVRFRAWQPPECLHPTIGVHAPLTFDIVDTWNNRSLGGCTYHVAHPGGRNYTTLPVNAYEAESRRLSRFFKIGHTPGRVKVPPLTRNPEFPLTLDLRHV